MSQAALMEPELDDDAPPPRKPRKLEDTETDMTPMIDMTFQLLIFFIVTFKSDPSGGVPLPTAKFGEAVSSKNAITVSVRKAEGDGPAMIYRGKATDEAVLIRTTDLKDQEAQLETYFAEESAKDANKTYIMIVAGHDVKYKDVKRVAEVASRIAEIQQLYVAVLEVK